VRRLEPAANGPSVEAWAAGPFGSRSRHRKLSYIDLVGHLFPGQALVPELQDLLCGGGMRRCAATHNHAGLLELLADGAPMNAQLGTDLAQGPTPGVQVGRTLNVHGWSRIETAYRKAR
jgi:hypothetical protein